MARAAKLYEKAKQSPNNFPFSDLRKLAEAAGFVHIGTSGDHHIYQHPGLGRDGVLNFQPQKGQAKPYQVRQLLDKIEEHGLLED